MTTQREIADQLGLPIHPPKVELFDLGPRTNTDSKQHVRAVDEYRVEPFGLYMARPLVDHPRASYVESWLLPSLGIRVTDWWWHPGQERDQDFYLDIATIEPGAARWRSLDLYLDIVVVTGSHADVLDIDEFLTALRASLLDDTTAQQAMTTTHITLDGLARHDYDLSGWLAEKDIELSWRPR
ncbi:hypothetical protein FHX42_003310 [Saccharopolyspora lacisalsi]|uniref:DUF402 domain-containing protein n=1 Tax=Halosaccharopolyspora lacisalsi TaxID=1000566 RepID=A0A839DWQ6_9PSEU|nr:DUF402 domain-containing protein [Halosaccharopolyspora lacisalsi]MBA8825944.1 hypothetical protein [Halosaccharopolyspora lacisalsi]